MSKTLAKRVREADRIGSYLRTQDAGHFRREEWDASTGRRWHVDGSVTMSCGMVVDVRCDCDGRVALNAKWRSRSYWLFLHIPKPETRPESLRRAAVAFAKRVRKAASRSRK